MAERSRRVRRQISEITEDSPDNSDAESEDFDPRRTETMRRMAKQEPAPTSRAKRNAVNINSTSPQAARSPSNDSKQSIKLTMKVAPSKLREVMRATELESLQDTLGGGKVIDAPRSSRRAQQAQTTTRVGTRPKYTEVHESDIEDEEEEEEADGDEGDEEAEEELEDTTMNDFEEVGAEAEGDTDDEDVEMEDQMPPVKKGPNPPKGPKITLKTPAKKGQTQVPNPKVVVTPANVGPVLSVEDQEMRDEEDDEDDEEEEEEEDDVTNVGDETNLNDEDPEGEEEVVGAEVEAEEEIDEEEDDDLDSDEDEEDDDEPGSGAATPDPTKLTSRQRGRPVEPLMALDMAPQQRKFFTDEEKAMKKDEHARKRKELTKRKTQEEKTAALNRLLKPQVSKTRGAAPKAETLAAQMQAAAEEEEIQQRADPLYTRWISTKEGIKLGVPDEWLGKQVGRCFGPPPPPRNGALVQELE